MILRAAAYMQRTKNDDMLGEILAYYHSELDNKHLQEGLENPVTEALL